MAITRSQIARQLLAEGGVSLDDAKRMAPEGEFLAYINPKEAQMLRDAGGSGIMTPMGIPSFVDFGSGKGSVAESLSEAAFGPSGPSGGGGGGNGDGGGNFSTITRGPKGPPQPGDGGSGQYITKDPYGKPVTTGGRRTASILSTLFFGPEIGLTVDQLLSKEQEKQKDLMNAIQGGQQFFGTLPDSLRTQYKETTGMKTGPKGPSGGDGGDDDLVKIPLPVIPRTQSNEESDRSGLSEFLAATRARNPNPFEISEKYRLAKGGEVRQEYGLGKLVKKVGRAVKKVAKSDIGKAAIAIGLGAYAGGLGPFAKGSTMFGGKLAGIKGAGFAQGLFPSVMDYTTPTRSFFTEVGKLGSKGISKFPGGGAGLTIAALSGASALMTPKQEEEELSKLIADKTGINVAEIRKEVQDAYASGDISGLRTKYPFLGEVRTMAADGGDIEDAPMETASMPSTFGELNQLSIDLFGRPYNQLNDSEQEILIEYFTKGKKQGIERATAAEGGMMDLGGNEMDLRGGGFVPIGKEEKADDVPARLSKNEFVFTADAVRAAGGGSVDKGADLMYKTMKQLENKVA